MDESKKLTLIIAVILLAAIGGLAAVVYQLPGRVERLEFKSACLEIKSAYLEYMIRSENYDENGILAQSRERMEKLFETSFEDCGYRPLPKK